MKKVIIIFILLNLFIMIGCTNAQKIQKEKKIETLEKKYEVVGNGVPSVKASNIASKRQTSYEEAKIIALKRIADYLYKIKLKSGILVKEEMSKNTKIKTEVALFIKNAEIIKREWDTQDNCSIIIRVDMEKFRKKLKELGVE